MDADGSNVELSGFGRSHLCRRYYVGVIVKSSPGVALLLSVLVCLEMSRRCREDAFAAGRVFGSDVGVRVRAVGPNLIITKPLSCRRVSSSPATVDGIEFRCQRLCHHTVIRLESRCRLLGASLLARSVVRFVVSRCGSLLHCGS